MLRGSEFRKRKSASMSAGPKGGSVTAGQGDAQKFRVEFHSKPESGIDDRSADALDLADGTVEVRFGGIPAVGP